jgi:hypothetical protein
MRRIGTTNKEYGVQASFRPGQDQYRRLQDFLPHVHALMRPPYVLKSESIIHVAFLLLFSEGVPIT